MTNQITNTPTRDNFIKFINEYLEGIDFKRDPDKESWFRNRQISVGGGMMVVNGQRQNIPGEIHNIKQIVEIFGDGIIKDIDTEIETSIIQIDFITSENDKIDYIDPQMCFFYDDQNMFIYLINQIFK